MRLKSLSEKFYSIFLSKNIPDFVIIRWKFRKQAIKIATFWPRFLIGICAINERGRHFRDEADKKINIQKQTLHNHRLKTEQLLASPKNLYFSNYPSLLSFAALRYVSVFLMVLLSIAKYTLNIHTATAGVDDQNDQKHHKNSTNYGISQWDVSSLWQSAAAAGSSCAVCSRCQHVLDWMFTGGL